jgi:adenosylcobinamide-phosphate synthase
MNQFAMAALALAVEMLVGYPPALQAAIGHPVEWIGKLITYLDEGLNDADVKPQQNQLHGVLAVLILCVCVGVPAWVLALLLAHVPFGWVLNLFCATSLIAQKSLRDHVSAVEQALGISLAQARLEIAKIVGRDPTHLNENGVAKAALESLAENTSDGIVAPLFWYAILGLPALVVYKAINTADSMIGHKSEKYLHFGWAAARLDDVVNLPAARLTGLLFSAAALLTSKSASQAAFKTMWRDAANHKSPNAGWPEAAMAGALNLRFGGPRQYGGEQLNLAFMGNGTDPNVKDIAKGLALYDAAMIIQLCVCVALAMAL